MLLWFMLFCLGRAEKFNAEGDIEYRNGRYHSAIDRYTKGIQATCKDESLNATLFSNRATTHFKLGKNS